MRSRRSPTGGSGSDPGTTAQLTFLDAGGKEWLSGSDIKKASYGYGNPTNGMSDQHYVEVQFTSEGRKKFR